MRLMEMSKISLIDDESAGRYVELGVSLLFAIISSVLTLTCPLPANGMKTTVTLAAHMQGVLGFCENIHGDSLIGNGIKSLP